VQEKYVIFLLDGYIFRVINMLKMFQAQMKPTYIGVYFVLIFFINYLGHSYLSLTPCWHYYYITLRYILLSANA